MPELHETMYGKKLLEHDIPEIHKQLKRIADKMPEPQQPLSSIEIEGIRQNILDELMDAEDVDFQVTDALLDFIRDIKL